MNKAERVFIDGSIKLSTDKEGGLLEEFRIKQVVGEGGSTICYDAIRVLNDGRVQKGKLKEFYPYDSAENGSFYAFKRLSNNQLVPKNGTIREFNEICDDYLNSHRIISSAIVSDEKNAILSNYIPQGTFYYGYIDPSVLDDSEKELYSDVKATVYTWSTDIVGKGFDKYLREIRETPKLRTEEQVRNILSAIIALTDCVKSLHRAGIVHTDIKPSNFMVQYDSDFNIKANVISLFDINSIWTFDSAPRKFLGTKGFYAPEASRRTNHLLDIYSIGATLFNAIVINDAVSDGLYQDEYYSSINSLVKNSALFNLSRMNSDNFVKRICKILSKCLARLPRSRYQSCSELKMDLEKALQELDKLMNKPVVRTKKGSADSTLIMQKLLYEHPLYGLEKDLKDLNVLVIGSETDNQYIHSFVDVCLQVGQMSDTNLNIKVISPQADEDKEAYLYSRPALSEFVNVNGSLKEEVAYANLEFIDIIEVMERGSNIAQFADKCTRNNQIIVNQVINNAKNDNFKYQYVLVALGNDNLCKEVADYCAQCFNYSIPICYLYQKKKTVKKSKDKKIYPVLINEVVDFEAIDKYIGEMAFNTHMAWDGNMNKDVKEERDKFFNAVDDKYLYNLTSSISFALSIKYKLHSVNIDCSDYVHAAKAFQEQVLDKIEGENNDEDAKQKFDKLADLEHRRWIIDRAVNGWRAPRDKDGKLKLVDCVKRGKVKDDKGKFHPCMVRGSARSPLSSVEYTKNNHEKWEQKVDSQLDELDRMSIELHQCFKKYADAIRHQNFNQNPDLLDIQNLIPSDNEKVIRAFNEFKFVLKNILNGVAKYSREYDHYLSLFKNVLITVPADIYDNIINRLNSITSTFFPVCESNLYRDYKANDYTLISKIPFILTYRSSESLAMAFDIGDIGDERNEVIFPNVASATVLNPKQIQYLFYFDENVSAKRLIKKIECILNYYNGRNVHFEIKMVICRSIKVKNEELNILENSFNHLTEKYSQESSLTWITQPIYYTVRDYYEATESFILYLKENQITLYDESTDLYTFTRGNHQFLNRLDDIDIPSFEFDWRNKEFRYCKDCEYLQYVEVNSFIRISDMFALKKAYEEKFNLPELANDYEEIWGIYTGDYITDNKFESGVRNWNELCEILAGYDNKRQPIVTFHLDNTGGYDRKLVYFLPEYSFLSIKKLLNELVNYKVIDRDYRFFGYASDTCKLEIKVKKADEEVMEELFSNPLIFLQYYNVAVTKQIHENSDCLNVIYNDLNVKNLNLEPESNCADSLIKLLDRLEEAHFITKVKRSESNSHEVSFTYSSPRIKKLLNSAGEILGIYSYYNVLKSDYFDDVVCGYEFNWELGGVKNELDLVLTKGFKSMIVECKAVKKLEQDYYLKLDSLATNFGIGTKKVLLGNTYVENAKHFNEINNQQISRGKQTSIYTISGEKNIVNVGEILKEIMENI